MTKSDSVVLLEKELQMFEVGVATGKLAIQESSPNFDHLFPIQNIVDSESKEDELLKLIMNCIVKSHYDEILQINMKDVFLKDREGNCEIIDALVYALKDYVSGNQSDAIYKRQLILLFVGIACLQKFVTCNWIGQCHIKAEKQNFADVLLDNTSSEKLINDALSLNGDPIYTNVENPNLLIISKAIFSVLQESKCVTRYWWMLRCLIIHQQILLERNVKLYEEIKDLTKKAITLDWVKEEENVIGRLQLLVEMGFIHLYYHEVVVAKQYFLEAQNIVGVELELCGAMGKRTQFQQKALAQLFVKCKRNPALEHLPVYSVDATNFPCDLHLQDDVLLKKVKFLDDEETIEELLPEEQMMLLFHCCLIQKSGASSELLEEEVMAYIECLLSQPKVWCIHIKTLVMRCKLEKLKSRRVERAMMQLQALVDVVNKENPPVSTRLYMFYCTPFPPKWVLEKELADILISLGAVKSALEIYQRLQLWEDMVLCYQRLEMIEQAASLVHEQIKLNETPALWCLLGDVLNDPKCYLKAWEISEQRNARSQRSLGFYYYRKKDFKSCISYFQCSLEINFLQPNVWFALGFASAQVEDHELAAQAYRHVVTMDSDHFEAWNNLSNSYIRLKQKPRAWRSLQEALKCNYENWRVWENYLLVCVDVGAFDDAIQAYHRLLDIKGKHEDDEVLGILAKAVLSDLPDVAGQPSSRLRGKVLSLFGRVTSKITSNSNIWSTYALLHSSDPNCSSSKEQTEKVLMYYQKAHRCLMQQPQWEKNFLTCKNVITNAEKLGDAYLTYLGFSDDASKVQTKSSAKLMLQGVITRVEQQLPALEDSQAVELKSSVENLKSELKKVVSL